MTRAKRALDGLDDDIREHIEREAQENIDRGMSPEEAYRRAKVAFGNMARAAEETRAVWGWRWLEQLAQDARYAVRTLRRRRGYAVLSVLTLALGIGGTAAVYGVAGDVLFAPLPYAHEREVGVFWKKTDWTHEEYLHIRGRVPGFRDVALFRYRDIIVRAGDRPPRLMRGVSASGELFDVLGAGPVIGRALRVGDDLPGAERVVVLSFALWQEMGGDPSIIGTRLTIDGVARTIVGVMPRGFWFPDPSVRVWEPELLNPESRSWNSTLIGRVAPDHNVDAMDAAVAALGAMLDERFEYPPQFDKSNGGYITPLRDDVIGPMEPALLATLAAMALILLIGCANVAALVLGQVDARSLDFAVRSALGAHRERLTQQLIVEVLLVAAIAGIFGAALAWAAFTVITDALPLGAWADAASPDWRVFVSAMAIAIATAWIVVLVPTISLYRSDLRAVLNSARTGGAGSVEGRGGRLENGLVIAQVALAVTIAAGAALLGRSVSNLYAVEPGVRVDGVAVVDVVLRGNGGRERRERVLDELATALRELPGVQSVGAVQQLPLRNGGYRAGLEVAERPDLEPIAAEYRIVTPGYLESVGIALRRGRTIGEADRRDFDRVVVVNEILAEKYFGTIDPIGKLLDGDGDKPLRIVGVVGNAVETRLTESAGPVRYVAVAQMPWIDDAQSLVVRAMPGIDEASLLEPARRTIARVAPAVTVQQTTTMARVLDVAIGPARQIVVLLSMLTALALILGAIGVYGVVAHFAARRRRDWAIRIALGLPGSRVIAQVVGHGTLLVTAGVAAGFAGAAVLARLLSSFLYGVSAVDPIAFATAGGTLLIVGSVAAAVPAWRAGTADPLIALREQ
jgi:putative ABC transport system permease protein